jgi:hypothetical protein
MASAALSPPLKYPANKAPPEGEAFALIGYGV